MVWTEPKTNKSSSGDRKVAVVYYLCRDDGQLDHPHFMEVTTTSDDTRGRLCLRDFTERLDMLRGKGMAAMYSWSSKRSYRNSGFVWHDLKGDDIIHPAQSHANTIVITMQEYVLKGSHRFSCRSRGRNGSSFDRVQAAAGLSSLLGTDDETSPPPSSSSPGDDTHPPQEATPPNLTSGGRRMMRASSLLMQLISCGSVTVKSHHYSRTRTRHEEEKETNNSNNSKQASSSSPSPSEGRDDREYFSGSLVDTKNKNKKKKNTPTAAALKRSSSCNVVETRSGARA